MTSAARLEKTDLIHHQLPQETTDPDAIDICRIAKKALGSIAARTGTSLKEIGKGAKLGCISGALVLTNSILTIAIGTLKLTGFTIITPLVIKCLTTHLHRANVALAKSGPGLLKHWAELLHDEHTRITEIEKVVWLQQGRPFFSWKNYKVRLHDSLKAIIAPVSLTFTALNAVLWLSVKPFYISLMLPGYVLDEVLTGSFALNRHFSKLTYSPLEQLAKFSFDLHTEKWLPAVGKEAGECSRAITCGGDCGGND